MTAQIRNVLHGKDVVLVYDGWSDRYSKRSYLGIVARYVDTVAKQIKNRILAVKDLKHPHTSENVRTCLMDVLQDYEVQENQVKLDVLLRKQTLMSLQLIKLVADNGANLRKCFTAVETIECEYDGIFLRFV